MKKLLFPRLRSLLLATLLLPLVSQLPAAATPLTPVTMTTTTPAELTPLTELPAAVYPTPGRARRAYQPKACATPCTDRYQQRAHQTGVFGGVQRVWSRLMGRPTALNRTQHAAERRHRRLLHRKVGR